LRDDKKSNKRKLDDESVKKYKEKIRRINRAIYDDPKIADQITEIQTKNWLYGREPYEKVDKIVKQVLDNEGVRERTYYYSASKKYVKEMLRRKEANQKFINEKVIVEYIVCGYPKIRMEIFEKIIKKIKESGILDI